jgi:hypothetical protein
MLKIEKITDKVEEELDVKGQSNTCRIVGYPTDYDCYHDCHDNTKYKSSSY